DTAAVGLPSGDATREMLVGVGDAAVVLFLEVVGERFRIGVATQPELLDELFALLIVGGGLEDLALFVVNDVAALLRRPPFVGAGELLLERLFLLGLVLVGEPGSLALARQILGIFLIILRGQACREQAENHSHAKAKYTPGKCSHHLAPLPWNRSRAWLHFKSLQAVKSSK